MNQRVFLQAAYLQGVKLACANANVSSEELEKQAAGAFKKVWEGAKAVGRKFLPQSARDASFVRRVQQAKAGLPLGKELPEVVQQRFQHLRQAQLEQALGPQVGADARMIENEARKAGIRKARLLAGNVTPVGPGRAHQIFESSLAKSFPASSSPGLTATKPILADEAKLLQRDRYRKALAEAHKKHQTGVGATTLGGSLVGAGIGGLTADKGEGTQGALRGAMVGGGLGLGAGLMGKSLLSAPDKFKSMTEAAKASGRGSEVLARIEKAKALYKQKALTRHGVKGLVGAGAGGAAGYLGANALLGSGQSPQTANQVPIGVGYDQPLYGNLPYGPNNPQYGSYQP